ncbi:MAG: VWA domain-containing protein [Planctomycetota bacterium]
MRPLLALLEVQRSTVQGDWQLGHGYSLADPWFLVLLPLVPLALFLGLRKSARARMVAPATLQAVPPSAAQRWSWTVPAASALSLLLGILALARPLSGEQRFQTDSEGVDIGLVLDRSQSMEEPLPGTKDRKFDLARRVVGEFARRRTTDREGAADAVALFGFARFTELLCPFTTDADAIDGVLAETEVEVRPDLGSTAIGVAIAKATEVLKQSPAKSRIVVLLTDGEERMRDVMEPLHAAIIAQAAGIKVYTIYVGPKRMLVRNLFGVEERVANVKELEKVAELTGGMFFHAEDGEQLEQAYADIEQLERTPRTQTQFAEHYDLYRPFVLASLVFGLIAMAGRHTWARRLPC